MELRAYASILGRHWLAVIILPLVALIAVVLFDRSRSTQYTAQARVSIDRISTQDTTEDYQYDDYYDLLTSDFILDDAVEVVHGNVFANAVAERLNEQGVGVDAGTVESSLDASREHRILSIRSTTDDSGLSAIIANMASLELREDYTDYLGAEDEPLPLTMRPVDIAAGASSDELRVRLVYVLAVIVASGFGVLLALALEYFDDALDVDSATAILDVPVLGVVRERLA